MGGVSILVIAVLTDFLRVGTPLNLLMALITPPLIMLFYGL
jgi:hypothetical protein